jgi:hypothetical protein
MKYFYGIYWLANLIYTILFWGGFWTIVANIIIPYAFIYDVVVKYGPKIAGHN